jgi:hypothetical protein
VCFLATILQSTAASKCGINPVYLMPLRKELAGCRGVGFKQVTNLGNMSKTAILFHKNVKHQRSTWCKNNREAQQQHALCQHRQQQFSEVFPILHHKKEEISK